jgi:hypothetical protein
MKKNGIHYPYKLNQLIGYKSINPMKKCGVSKAFPLQLHSFLW